MRNLFDLTGKVIAVIGGGSGIGAAVTRGAAAHGARVLCFDVKTDAQPQIELLDIRDAEAVDRALTAARERHGRLDAVICTPSINVRKKILDYNDEELDRVLTLNIKGNFNVLRGAGRIMTADRRGSIVLFSSIRSQVVEPGQSVYAATKAGILQMARAAAAEFGPFGVRVNAVAPGVIETPLTEPIKSNESWYKAYAEKTVFKRWGTAEEMVGPTLFLVSDAASYVTGTLLVADGGWLAADGRFTPPGM
jgi:NAD(P)-dependent dehydrogenase (short-subunit alcohol dehydrogenase family)